MDRLAVPSKTAVIFNTIEWCVFQPLQSAPQAAIDKGSDDGVALTRNLFSSLSPSAVVKLQGAMGPVVTV